METQCDGFRFARVVLFAILASAVALRFFGLRWGLPNELHDYSYHPDEFLTIGAAFATIYIKRTWNPGFYNYPSLYIYLSTMAIAVGLGYGAKPEAATIYLCARVMTALMGTFAVLATWWAGRILFGETVGVLAALVICVSPIHVQHSHFATVDVPSTMFVALALGFAGLILQRGYYRDYLLSGAMAGLAAGTKYNAGLIFLSPIVSHFLRQGMNLSSLKSGRLWGAIGCALGAFVISTPGSILASRQFLHGFVYEIRHAAEGHGLVFAGTGNGFVYTFTNSLWYGLGPGLALLFGLALLWALWKRNKQILAVLAFTVPYYVLISLSQVRFARYSLPLFPSVALLIGWIMREWYQILQKQELSTMIARYLWVILCGAALCYSLLASIALDMAMVFPDPRDLAARWVFKHVPMGTTIGVVDWPWFYSPPLSKDLGFGTMPQRRTAAEKSKYRLVKLNGDTWKLPPQWIILSDYEIADAQRLGKSAQISANDRQEVNRILRILRRVEINYVARKSFGGNLFGLMNVRAMPHDMRYPFPEITIYELRK